MKIILIIALFFLSFFSFSQSVNEQAIIYLNSGKTLQAKLLLEEQVSENYTDLKTIELLGDIASFEKKWDLAISYYKQLIDVHPKNPDFNLKYGGALGMKALSVSRVQALIYIPDIKKHLELAAQLDRSQIESRRALVELYMKLPGILGGSEEKALSYAHQLKSLSPVNTYLAHGFIIKERSDIDEAMVYYKSAFNAYRGSQTRKSSNSLNYELGKVSAELNIETAYGAELLDKYIANYSYKDIYSMEWVYLRKAQILANLNDKKQALKLIEKALTLKDNFKEAIKERERIQAL